MNWKALRRWADDYASDATAPVAAFVVLAWLLYLGLTLFRWIGGNL